MTVTRFRLATAVTTATLAVLIAASGCGYLSPENYRERKENYIALNAKLLCSCAFVIGRDTDEFIANDLTMSNPLVPGWEEIEVTVDRERKAVTLRTEGVPARTAVYNGDQGCTLLPRGMERVQFTPVPLTSALPPPESHPWPTGDVLSEAPLPAEVNSTALEAALDAAFNDLALPVPQKTRAMVVVYKGRIIAERYAPGFDRDTRHICWSMGKSIASTLVGILVGDGHFRVEDPAPIPEWRGAGDPRGAITIQHLLHMSSGLRFHTGGIRDGLILTNRDNHRFVYSAAPNVFEYSISNDLEFEPNTVWRYRNCDPLTLGKIIRDTVEARGEEYLSFPHRALFDRIGMRRTVLEPDPWGNFIMTGFDYGTARDWARLGLLYLWDGQWQGERILPEGWARYVRTPAPRSPEQGYGALFWLNAGGHYHDLPPDMYWAGGHQGQRTTIIPSREMVIVRLGHSNSEFEPYIETVLTEILAAVGPPAPDAAT